MVEIRDYRAGDAPALEALYSAAFSEEDLLTVLRDLLAEPASLSLVAVVDGDPAGHIAFTACGVEGSPASVSLLGPLAVAPAQHRRGIGSELVRTGLERITVDGASRAFVLGDPRYYGRFGFEADRQVSPPYPLPAEWDGAWQSLGLGDGSHDLRGRLTVPPPWRHPEYWAP